MVGRCNTGSGLAGTCINAPIEEKSDVQPPISVITLCHTALDGVSATLTEYVAKTYTSDEVALEVLLRTTASFYLIHELSHAVALTGLPPVLGKHLVSSTSTVVVDTLTGKLPFSR